VTVPPGTASAPTAPAGPASYGLLTYHTDNVGDDVQSLAARRFVPSVDRLVDRESLHLLAGGGQRLRLIMNGWFLHDPASWPPAGDGLDPLLVSMHFNLTNPLLRQRLETPDSRSFLAAHAPVGARDTATLAFLDELGVPAYWSGCLTLTLERDPRLTRQSYVLAVGLADELTAALRETTDRPVVAFSPFLPPDADLLPQRRLVLAELLVAMYQCAHAVVTTRLHAALPCVALGTPVVLVEDSGEGYFGTASERPGKYSGLLELVRHCRARTLLDSGYDLERPPPNPRGFEILRDRLVERCTAFTGYSDARRSFARHDFGDLLADADFVALVALSLRHGERLFSSLVSALG
jgi:hypothetical protein